MIQRIRARDTFLLIAVVALLTAGSVTPVNAAATAVVADWQMNESSDATVMTDSSGNGINGVIGSAVRTGVLIDGATAYRWTHTNPNEPPAKPERLVQVANSALNPRTGDYAITMRFRTTRKFGNMIQKGQSGSKTGFFKWQIPNGKLTCLFRGVDGQGNTLSRSVSSGTTLLNDGAWHTVRCERTANRMTMTIDGTITRRANGPTGSITNNVPFTIGGKLNCDQIKSTCDYFVGDIDWVKIESG